MRRITIGGGLAAFLLLSGSALPGQGPGPAADKPLAKPYVEILLGKENYQKAAPRLVVGRKAKFRGQLAFAVSKGNKLVIQLAELYTGDKPAIRASRLIDDFMINRAKAEQKYRAELGPSEEIIIEGVVGQLQPEQSGVVLAGSDG